MARQTIRLPHPVDLAKTLFPLVRGAGDPTTRIEGRELWRSSRTPQGPATLHLLQTEPDVIDAEAFGPGSEIALRDAPGLAGALDDDAGFPPPGAHPLIRDLHRRLRAIRLTRANELVRLLVPTIFEQKVTGIEARRAYRRLTLALGEPAPGPDPLLLPPDPARIAALPYERFHPFGVERRRADVLRSVCARADRLERLLEVDPETARRELERFPGIGPWTSSEVTRLAFGDPDAVSIGDYHLPHLVTWALAAEPRGTDDRMLELLEPYRGHRARVQLLLERGLVSAPRFGPKLAPRAIERL